MCIVRREEGVIKYIAELHIGEGGVKVYIIIRRPEFEEDGRGRGGGEEEEEEEEEEEVRSRGRLEGSGIMSQTRNCVKIHE